MARRAQKSSPRAAPTAAKCRVRLPPHRYRLRPRRRLSPPRSLALSLLPASASPRVHARPLPPPPTLPPRACPPRRQRPPTSPDLAAAKRGGRARARARRHSSPPARPATAPTPAAAASASASASTSAAAAAPTAAFVLPDAAVSPDDEARRNALLRRLNQINRQRFRLERVVSADAPSPPDAPAPAHDLDVPAGDADIQVLARIRRTSAAGAAGAALVNGAARRHAASKRRRADAAAPPPRNGRHAGAGRRRGGAHASTAMHLDVDHVPKQPPQTIDLMLVDAARPEPAATPPPTPGVGQRGSGRVRTPSVLLSSHPGEKVVSGQSAAASKNRQLAYCMRMVKDMLRLKDGFGFSKPIDQLWAIDQLPGYFDVIKHPMDLDTVRQRLETDHYLTSPGKEEVEEVSFDLPAFSKDMRLIFRNAQTYNRPGDIFYEAAKRLSEKFETKISQMPSLEQLAAQAAKKNKKRKKGQTTLTDGPKKHDSVKRRKSAEGAPTSQPKSRQNAKKKVPSAAKKPKPAPANNSRKKTGAKSAPVVTKNVDSMSAEELEARFRALERQRAVTQPGSPAASSTGLSSYVAEAQALYNVKVTEDEIIELSRSIFKLPPEKIKKVIAMASKNQNSSVEVTQDEEIVLDFESMNNKTLRDIQALVRQTLYKNKKAPIETGPNADVYQMTHSRVLDEMDKIRAVQRRRSKGKPSNGDKDKNQKSFYDSDEWSSDSDDSDGSGSESDDEGSSSGGTDSSDDESGSDYMRKTRERNLAHQQAMQAAGTPLSSPPYQNRVP